MEIADQHQEKVLIDIVKRPLLSELRGGMDRHEAARTLREKFGWSDKKIKELWNE